ncbi:hypothetical protein CBM2605_A260036 [Cupriavidus neocaledonicus]|uniref:Uncharacterized protein n=1 Tax=Cupriavidus neocaledonicus TaxID=1040979 RepID=A0ABY1V1D9_9BURK|nr:hypothetical protein CBM2605_A260036 [Cupriavidus neocaledonicus]
MRVSVDAEVEAVSYLLLMLDEIVKTFSQSVNLICPNPGWDIGCLLRVDVICFGEGFGNRTQSKLVYQYESKPLLRP